MVPWSKAACRCRSGRPPPASCRTVARVIRRAFDWTFRSREDGRIVVAQFPNLPLAVFLVATFAGWVLTPDGTVGTVLSWVARAALVWWAVLEVGWGVNPFRRVLGATFLGLVAWRLVSGA
jgi:hypothetical protein